MKKIDADTAVGGSKRGTTDAVVNVSSPAATGGAGTVFEHHVDAYWLALLLVSGIPPILIDNIVSEVSFQTKRQAGTPMTSSSFASTRARRREGS